MKALIRILRTGSFFSANRLYAYSALSIVVYVVSSLSFFAYSGFTLSDGKPAGNDFISFWIAAKSALNGEAAILYDPNRLHSLEQSIFPDIPFIAFFYPPIFILFLVPFGYFGFFISLAFWILCTAVVSVVLIRSIVGRTWLSILIVLSFPATFINIVHGQNAFLTATLLAGGVLMLERSQIAAGILIGLLAYKPQFGLLLPIALLAGSYWRAIASAVFTIVLLFAISAGTFGTSIWVNFFHQLPFVSATMQQGFVDWDQMISVYAMLRSSGVGHGMSMAAQIGTAAIAAFAVVWVSRVKTKAAETRIAILIIGSLVASPFALSYDYFIILPALVLLARQGISEGFLPYEKSLLVLMFALPLVGAIFAFLVQRIDAVFLLILLAVAACRFNVDRRT